MSPAYTYVVNLLLVLFLVFCNAFFVVSEFSIVKIRRTKLEELELPKSISSLGQSCLLSITPSGELSVAVCSVTVREIRCWPTGCLRRSESWNRYPGKQGRSLITDDR